MMSSVLYNVPPAMAVTTDRRCTMPLWTPPPPLSHAELWRDRVDLGRRHWRVAYSNAVDGSLYVDDEHLAHAQLALEAALHHAELAVPDELIDALVWHVRRYNTQKDLATLLYLRGELGRCVEMISNAVLSLEQVYAAMPPDAPVSAGRDLMALMTALTDIHHCAVPDTEVVDNPTPAMAADPLSLTAAVDRLRDTWEPYAMQEIVDDIRRQESQWIWDVDEKDQQRRASMCLIPQHQPYDAFGDADVYDEHRYNVDQYNHHFHSANAILEER